MVNPRWRKSNLQIPNAFNSQLRWPDGHGMRKNFGHGMWLLSEKSNHFFVDHFLVLKPHFRRENLLVNLFSRWFWWWRPILMLFMLVYSFGYCIAFCWAVNHEKERLSLSGGPAPQGILGMFILLLRVYPEVFSGAPCLMFHGFVAAPMLSPQIFPKRQKEPSRDGNSRIQNMELLT